MPRHSSEWPAPRCTHKSSWTTCGGLGESCVGVAEGDLIGNDLVRAELAAYTGRARRSPAIGRRRQHLVVDGNKRDRVLGHVAVGGNDDRHRLADERNFTVGERKRPTAVEPGARIRHPHHPALLEHRREIVEREHGNDAGQPARSVKLDAADQRMRMRTAHEGRRKRTRRDNVVDEARSPAQQLLILDARNARADDLAQGCRNLVSASGEQGDDPLPDNARD